MSSYINRGESVFFQFRNGKSVMNSQCKPRMFKTAEKATLGVNYIKTDDVVEYAEVKRGYWVGTADGYADGELVYDMWECSECGYDADGADEKPNWNYCPNCGAKITEVLSDAD